MIACWTIWSQGRLTVDEALADLQKLVREHGKNRWRPVGKVTVIGGDSPDIYQAGVTLQREAWPYDQAIDSTAGVAMAPPPPTPLPDCDRCGHPADWHRQWWMVPAGVTEAMNDDVNDDHADPDCPFRCLGYDVDAFGPSPDGRACDCPNYQEPT